MPFNGSGVFSIVNTFVPGTTIFSSAVNANFTDIATGLSTTVLKDGSQTITADIPMAGFGFTGLGRLGSQAPITVASAATTDILSQSSLFIIISGTGTITSFGADAASRRNQTKFVRATGSFTITHSASIACPGSANIVAKSGDTFIVTSDSSSNCFIRAYQRFYGMPGQVVTPGFIFGLTLSNDGSDATNDIDIDVGYATDSADAVVMNLASALVKRSDANWAVGTNQGMLDTGAIGNGWYYVFLIERADTGVVDVLCSLSATAPTMPANYGNKRRIGAFFRTGGAIKAFVQVDDRFMWKVPVNDITQGNPGTSAQTPTLTIPPIRVDADILVVLTDTTPAVSTEIFVSSPDQTDTAASAAVFTFVTANAGATVPAFAGGECHVSTSNGTVRYRLSSSTADHAVSINTNGWTDHRGRLS